MTRNSGLIRLIRCCLVAAVLLITININSLVGYAQQMIFNTPSADVAERGRTFIELNSAFRPFETNRYATFYPRVNVGVAKGLELSAGLYHTEGGHFGDNSILTVASKWRFYNNEDTGTSLAVSSQLFAPLRGTGEKASVLTFGGLHQVIKPTSTRLSFGVYNGTPGALAINNYIGGWASVEQPIGSGFSAVADWLSGNQRFGAFTPGVSFNSNRQFFRLGYSINNFDHSRNGFVIRYGIWLR